MRSRIDGNRVGLDDKESFEYPLEASILFVKKVLERDELLEGEVE